MLSFQRLDIYQCATQFLAYSINIATRAPKGYASLAEQFRRAALSCPLNIAEAAGRLTEMDAARHYAIARGSAMECAAILDSLKLLSAIGESEHQEGVRLLERMVSMLTKLAR